MKKMFQSDWHGIHFESFSPVSETNLAGAEFYAAFYSAFFKKYMRMEELDRSWIRLKMQLKGFLEEDSRFTKDSSILSIGCGLGFVEKAFIEQGYNRLEVTEVSKEPLTWLLPYIPADRVHIGFFPASLPDRRKYDYIYLAGVETFFSQTELIEFLKAVSGRLNPGGRCVIISWSFRPRGLIPGLAADIKDAIKSLLSVLGLKRRGQFWGYIRSRTEFHQALCQAGFIGLKDGFFEKKTRWDTYWIAADKVYEPY